MPVTYLEDGTWIAVAIPHKDATTPKLEPEVRKRFAACEVCQCNKRERAACEADRHLLSIPAFRKGRNQLSDVVRAKGDALARKAHKYLTLAKVYNERETFAARRDVVPTYYDWLVRFMRPEDARRESERASQEWATRRAEGTA